MTTTNDPYTSLRGALTGMPPVPGLDAMGATIHEPTAEQRMRAQPQQPEEVIYLPGPGGTMVPVLAEHYTPATTPTPAPTVNERDKWPLRMVTGGGATAAVLGVVGHYGPGISQAGHGAEMAGIAVAATAAGVGILISVVKASFGSPKQPISLSVHVTNTNTSRSTSSSRSKHHSR